MIPYDPSSDALLQPELHEPLFREGVAYTLEQLAAECARLAYLRYDVDATEHLVLTTALSRVAYHELQCFVAPETDTQAFAAYNATSNHVILAFRGTQNNTPRDWVTDMRFALRTLRGPQQVHSGFDEAWRSVAAMIRHWLAVPLTKGAHLCLTGHSLGGALATRASLELPCDTLVTLGAPRAGNAAFADAVSKGVRDVHRFVNCCDVVPHVPPPVGYAHAGEVRYIDRHGLLTKGEVSTLSQEGDQAMARTEWIAGMPSAPPGRTRVLMRELADHAPINYLRALF